MDRPVKIAGFPAPVKFCCFCLCCKRTHRPFHIIFLASPFFQTLSLNTVNAHFFCKPDFQAQFFPCSFGLLLSHLTNTHQLHRQRVGKRALLALRMSLKKHNTNT